MGELLGALEAGMRGKTRWVAAGGVAAGVAVAVGVALARPTAPRLCAGAEREIAGAWGDTQRAAVAAAFDASGNPRAKDAFARVRPVLDDYARRWAAMRTESCEATRVRGVQSDEALDLRTTCLDQRRSELAATGSALAAASPKLVDDAVKLARSLSELEVCADVPALRAPFAQPHDPAERAKVASIRDEIGRATALAKAQKSAEALDLATRAVGEARALKSRALEGQALLQQDAAVAHDGNVREALRIARDAALAANVARDDATEARAWLDAIFDVGISDGRVEDAEMYAALADAAITRAGNPDALRSRLAERRADVLYARGATRESLALYKETLDYAIRAWGPQSAEVAEREANVATAEADLGHVRDAVATLKKTAAKEAAQYGESPLIAMTLYWLAGYELVLGEAEDALRNTQRLVATGVTGTKRIHGLLTEGRARIALGDVENGKKVAAEAIAEYAVSFGAKDWHVGAASEDVAETLVRRHLLDDADAYAARAIELLSGTTSNPGSLAQAREVRMLCAARRGRADVLRDAEARLVEAEKEADDAPIDALLPRLVVGEAALAAKKPERAVTALEEAAKSADDVEGYPELVADVHFDLARALLASHGDAPRARRLLERAAREYEDARLPDAATLARELDHP
jgi:hypothetical protein